MSVERLCAIARLKTRTTGLDRAGPTVNVVGGLGQM